jgi:hypothetical protein
VERDVDPATVLCAMNRCKLEERGLGRGGADEYTCETCGVPVHGSCSQAVMKDGYDGYDYYCDNHWKTNVSW